MTSLELVLLTVCVNTLISAVYIVAAFIRKSAEMKISGLIILITPPAGAVYYLGQFIIRALRRREREIQLDDIGFSKERRNRILSPDLESEMQAVPLEELFLVSTDAEKRRNLLSELKKDYIANYAVITKAFDNDDPETSHYAAAAITNAKTAFENDIREYDGILERNSDNPEFVRRYADYVLSYLRSGILDDMELKKYRYLYLNLMSSRRDDKEVFFSEADYTNIVDESILNGDYEAADQWANDSRAYEESEHSYLNLLKVYYYTSRPEQFSKTLDQLKRSGIPLSEEGLSLVRFFLKAQGGPASAREQEPPEPGERTDGENDYPVPETAL